MQPPYQTVIFYLLGEYRLKVEMDSCFIPVHLALQINSKLNSETESRNFLQTIEVLNLAVLLAWTSLRHLYVF